MQPQLLVDSDVIRLAQPEQAVACMTDALIAAAAGDLDSPPRVTAGSSDHRVVLTAGATAQTYGYRVYDTLDTPLSEQVVVAIDRPSGQVVAVATGTQLGALRTGALGGAAARLLGPATGPVTIGVVGAGVQAWTQLWAMSATHEIAEVRITSRTSSSRVGLAERVRSELGIPAVSVSSASDAVAGAQIVILATTSDRPVIEPSWLDDDVLVITLGHKQVGRAEFDTSLLDGAALITTDSPEQLRSYDPPALVAAAGRAGDVEHLGKVAAGAVAAVRTGRRVHLSVGLAGTEPLLLRMLAASEHGPAGSGSPLHSAPSQ